jgi:hypothetical protein
MGSRAITAVFGEARSNRMLEVTWTSLFMYKIAKKRCRNRKIIGKIGGSY